MRESGAEGSEGRAKLRDERHSHVIRERERDTEQERNRERSRQPAVVGGHGATLMRMKATQVFTASPHCVLQNTISYCLPCIEMTLEAN